MKKNLLYLFCVVLIATTGCTAKGCASFNKKFQMSARDYEIEVYSGGKLIKTYKFEGTLHGNNESGYYFFDHEGKLVKLPADIIITSE